MFCNISVKRKEFIQRVQQHPIEVKTFFVETTKNVDQGTFKGHRRTGQLL